MSVLSPLIAQWAKLNKVFLFDFDKWMYWEDLTNEHLIKCVNDAISYYDYFLVCEQHPFVGGDKYYRRRNQILEIISPQIKTLFSTADWSHWSMSNTSDCTFLPTWYFEQRAWSLKLKYNEFKFNNNRPYVFSCVNKFNLRPEKIVNYMKCYARHSPDWFITMYKQEGLYIPKLVLGLDHNESELWAEEVRPNLKPFVNDLENSKVETYAGPFSLLFSGYTQAHVNLAIEHSMEFAIASEKTYKPFAAEQIPIFLGYPGIAKFINELGFDIFSDIVNHSYYDSIEQDSTYAPWLKRINAVHSMIDNLLTTDFKNKIVSETVWQRRRANKEYFYSDSIDKKCINWLDYLLKNNKR